MSYTQNLLTTSITVTRVYKWYASESGTGDSIPSGATLLFTRPTLTDATTVANFVVEQGLFGQYIWVEITANASGYETATKCACVGTVATDVVTHKPTWISGSTTNGTLYGITSDLHVANTVGISSTEFENVYNPSVYATGDNSQTNASNLQSAYSVEVTRSYKWVYGDANLSDDEVKALTTIIDEGTNKSEVTIPTSAVNKYIYCYITYSISDPNYFLSKSYDIKAYSKAVVGGTLTFVLDSYVINDARKDNVTFGIHDEVSVSIKEATDGVSTYTPEQIKALNLDNWTWTWKTNDAEPVVVDSATTSNDGLTSTLVLAKGKELVGKKLTVSVSASSDAYATATGNKGAEFDTNINKAGIAIVTSTIVVATDLVYGTNSAIMSSGVPTSDDVDVTFANMYWAIDTPLTSENYLTAGTASTTTPTTNTDVHAHDINGQIDHKLYFFYPGDDDHQADDDSVTFKVAKAPRTITIKNGENEVTTPQDIIYGNSETFNYTIVGATNATSNVKVYATQDNLANIELINDATSSSVANNAKTDIVTGNVLNWIDTDTIVTVSAETTYDYEAIEKSFAINTTKRTLTIETKSSISDTTPRYGDEVIITRDAFTNFGNEDTDADVITPIAYQWYEADSANGTGVVITGATDKTYTPTASQADNNKFIYCVITYGIEGTRGVNYNTIDPIEVRTEAKVAKRTMVIDLTLSGDAIYGQLISTNTTITDMDGGSTPSTPEEPKTKIVAEWSGGGEATVITETNE